MSVTTYKLPTAIIANGVGVNSWTNPNNILLVDGKFTSTSGATDELTIGTFNLNIPDNSTITNFTIKVKGYRGAFNTALQIYALDVSTGTTLAYPAVAYSGFTGTNEDHVLPSTLFGTTWRSNQANSIQFKLITNGELHLDSFQVLASYVEDTPITPVAPSIGEEVIDEYVQAQEFQLAQSITDTQTFAYLESFNLPNGNPIQIEDFHGDAQLVIDKGIPGKEENVRITNVEHDYNGTGLVRIDFTSLSNRGLGFIYPYTSVTENIVSHIGTASVVISNSAPFYDRFLKKNQINALVSAPIIVEDESVPLTDPVHTLDFQGAGVNVVNDGTDPFKKIVTIAGTGVNPPIAVESSSATSGNVQVPSIDWLHVSSGINRLLVVQVSTEAANTITGITYNGIALTQEISDTNGDVRQEQWFLVAPPVGNYSIEVTTSADSYITAGAQTYVSVNQTTPIGASDSAAGASVTPTVDLITTVDNSIVADGLATSELPIVYTVGAGQTSNWSITANPNTFQGASSIESAGSTPDTVTMSYAITQSTDWAITALEIIGVGYAGGVQSVIAGANVSVDNTDPANPIVSSTGGGSSGISESVNQVAHGFIVGDIIKSAGTDNVFAKAQADSEVNAEVLGIVTAVADVDNFTYAKDLVGYAGAGIPAGTPGEAVWLSPTVAGAMTITKPIAVGQVQKPLGQITASGTAMNFTADMRGELITNSITTGGNNIANPTVTPPIGTVNGTGSPVTIYTETIPAGILATNKGIYFKMFVWCPSRDDDFTLEVNYGGSKLGEVSVNIGTSTASYEAGVWIEGHIFNSNSTSAQVGYLVAHSTEASTGQEAIIKLNQASGSASDTTSGTSRLTSTVDSTVSQDLDFDMTVGSGDSVFVEFLQVFIG